MRTGALRERAARCRVALVIVDHNFDGDHDGIGCEIRRLPIAWAAHVASLLAIGAATGCGTA